MFLKQLPKFPFLQKNKKSIRIERRSSIEMKVFDSCIIIEIIEIIEGTQKEKVTGI